MGSTGPATSRGMGVLLGPLDGRDEDSGACPDCPLGESIHSARVAEARALIAREDAKVREHEASAEGSVNSK